MINLEKGFSIVTQTGGYGYVLQKKTGKVIINKDTGKKTPTFTCMTYHKDIPSALSTYRERLISDLVEEKELDIRGFITELKKIDKEFCNLISTNIGDKSFSVLIEEVSKRKVG